VQPRGRVARSVAAARGEGARRGAREGLTSFRGGRVGSATLSRSARGASFPPCFEQRAQHA
jgi:hypothetical protein